MTNDDGTQPTEHTPPMFVTHTRETISPYLPPPVLRMMQTIDAIPQLRNIVGDEPTMTLSTMLLLIYVVGWVLKFVTSTFGGKKAAVEGLDDDAPEGSVLSNLDIKSSIKNEVYGDSVILFGPSGSGKVSAHFLYICLCFAVHRAYVFTLIGTISQSFTLLLCLSK